MQNCLEEAQSTARLTLSADIFTDVFKAPTSLKILFKIKRDCLVQLTILNINLKMTDLEGFPDDASGPVQNSQRMKKKGHLRVLVKSSFPYKAFTKSSVKFTFFQEPVASIYPRAENFIGFTCKDYFSSLFKNNFVLKCGHKNQM